MRTAHPDRQAGLTLIEVCAVLAITAILVGTALPSFKNTLERHTLQGHASEAAIDLQYLRSEVVSRNQAMHIGFANDAGGSCYVIHTRGPGDCHCASDGVAQCIAGAQAIKTVAIPASTGVRIQSNVASMLFYPRHGTVSPSGTVRLIDRSGREIRHVVNMLGRVRSCSPGGAIPTYKPC